MSEINAVFAAIVAAAETAERQRLELAGYPPEQVAAAVEDYVENLKLRLGLKPCLTPDF